jgi:hypothetical protein
MYRSPCLDDDEKQCQSCHRPSQYYHPLTKMWRIITNYIILVRNILEYVKVTKIAMIQVLGLVEDKWVFNNLTFIKFRIHNHLDCVFSCLGHPLQCQIFLVMKLWAFGSHRNVNMLWMLEGSSIVGCPLPNVCILRALRNWALIYVFCVLFWFHGLQVL